MTKHQEGRGSLGTHSHASAKQYKLLVCFCDGICVDTLMTPSTKQKSAPRPDMVPNDSAIFNDGGGMVVNNSQEPPG